MNQKSSFIKGKYILVVDDEQDVLDTIKEILFEAKVDVAADYNTASEKIFRNHYDLALLDIMGVSGLKLLEECVEKDIPAIMFTANSMNPESLIESIHKGAISYLPKEYLGDIDIFLNNLLGAKNDGKPTWKILFDNLGDYFDSSFGQNWKTHNQKFWNDFEKDWKISKGIQAQLKHSKKIKDKGV